MTTLLHDIRTYMESSEYIADLRKTVSEKVNPIFIFAKLSENTLEIGAASLKSKVHMPHFSLTLDLRLADIDLVVSCRAYQMGMVHGLRAQALAAVTGPMFCENGGIVYKESTFADEVGMFVQSEQTQPDTTTDLNNTENEDE